MRIYSNMPTSQDADKTEWRHANKLNSKRARPQYNTAQKGASMDSKLPEESAQQTGATP